MGSIPTTVRIDLLAVQEAIYLNLVFPERMNTLIKIRLDKMHMDSPLGFL